jgi:hypothetical protein
MAWVGDAIMKNGGLARENGRSFWMKLTMVDEEDRKDGFLERRIFRRGRRDSIEELERESLAVLRIFPLRLK